MPDYDAIDPAVYRDRFNRIPRERYLFDHWRPVTDAAMERYCHGQRVLDLGCGFGDYTRSIQNTGLVVGLDLSNQWLRHARSVGGITNLIRADAQQVPLLDSTFDAVLSVGLLEYTRPVEVIGEIARLLVIGGFCVLVAPNRFSAFRLVLRLLLALRQRPYDVHEPSLGELTAALRTHGIEPIEVRMDDGLVWLPDWLDQHGGAQLYGFIERLFRLVGGNPLSNEMLIVGRKRA